MQRIKGGSASGGGVPGVGGSSRVLAGLGEGDVGAPGTFTQDPGGVPRGVDSSRVVRILQHETLQPCRSVH